jgi:hypothetical protein
MVPKDLIRAGDFAGITAITAEAVVLTRPAVG